MTDARLALGRRGEDAAANFLKRKGMKILEKNMRTPVGEIDLIAKHRKTLAFVEVKTRSGQDFGCPAEAVGKRKQQQIIRAASWYLNEHDIKDLQPRFDVIAVLIDGEVMNIEHIPNAFEL